MWKKQVEEESMKVGLRRKEALCHSKWSVFVNKIAAGLRWIWPPSLIGDTTRFKYWCLSIVHSILCILLMYVYSNYSG